MGDVEVFVGSVFGEYGVVVGGEDVGYYFVDYVVFFDDEDGFVVVYGCECGDW